MVSASCGLASCSGRQSGGHLHHPCDPRVVSCRCHHRHMIGRTGLFRRDSRGIDTSHTSKSRWDARRLQSGTHRLNWLYVPMEGIQSLTAHRQPSYQSRHRSASCAPAPDSLLWTLVEILLSRVSLLLDDMQLILKFDEFIGELLSGKCKVRFMGYLIKL